MAMAGAALKDLFTVVRSAADELADEDLARLSLEQLEDRIDRLDGAAQQSGREAVLSKVEIGRCLAVRKAQQPKGFVSWAKKRWGYSQQYGTVLMFLAENHARVRDLLDSDPQLPLRKVASALKQELKDSTEATPRAQHLFPVATPEDVVLEVLDAALPLPPRAAAFVERHGGVQLLVTSWPFCLGQTERGYVDYTDYGTWTRYAGAWADQIETVLAPNGRAIVNLPLDIRKDQPRPRPMAFDGLRLLLMSGVLHYEAAIVWRKSDNGHKSNSRARGSVVSPNAPALATGDELLLVVHKGEWNLGRPGEPNDLDAAALEWTNAEWTITGESDKDYAHVLPRELVDRCIKLLSFPGDLVADLHCGRGTVAVAAMQLGRPFVGGDVNPYAVALATRRVQSAFQAQTAASR